MVIIMNDIEGKAIIDRYINIEKSIIKRIEKGEGLVFEDLNDFEKQKVISRHLSRIELLEDLKFDLFE